MISTTSYGTFAALIEYIYTDYADVGDDIDSATELLSIAEQARHSLVIQWKHWKNARWLEDGTGGPLVLALSADGVREA